MKPQRLFMLMLKKLGLQGNLSRNRVNDYQGSFSVPGRGFVVLFDEPTSAQRLDLLLLDRDPLTSPARFFSEKVSPTTYECRIECYADLGALVERRPWRVFNERIQVRERRAAKGRASTRGKRDEGARDSSEGKFRRRDRVGDGDSAGTGGGVD